MTNNSVTQAKSFSDWAYIAIEKHYNKMLNHEENVVKDTDTEELHQMRVGIRRLRSAIAGFAPAIELPQAAENKKIGKIGRDLGELRDIDVLQETLEKTYLESLPENEQTILTQALKTLTKRRNKAFKNVKKTLEGSKYQKLKEALENWLKQPTYQKLGQVNIQLVLADLLLPEISKLLLHPGWLVGVKIEDNNFQVNLDEDQEKIAQILSLEAPNLHSLRKEAKKVRYQLELFTQFYGEKYQEYLTTIKDIQTVLGEIQDFSVLTEFLDDAIKLDWRQQMPTLWEKMNEIHTQQYHQWQKLQMQFLKGETRQELHQLFQQSNMTIISEMREENQAVDHSHHQTEEIVGETNCN